MGPWPNQRGFANQPTNPAGLIDMGARPYNPDTGLFLQPDPIITPTKPLSLNSYTYTNADPINNTDPTGLAQQATPPQDPSVIFTVPRGTSKGQAVKHGLAGAFGGAAAETFDLLDWAVPGDPGNAISAGQQIRNELAAERQSAGVVGYDPYYMLGYGVGAATTLVLPAGPVAKAGNQLIGQAARKIAPTLKRAARTQPSPPAPVQAAQAGAAWDLPVGGGGSYIDGRWYTEHALERMAPDTPEVRAVLERRALARDEAAGLLPGTVEFGAWWAKNGPDPRGVPPMVVKAEISSPGATNVRVIMNAEGDVVTVIPR